MNITSKKAPAPEYAQRGWQTVALGGVLPSVEQLQDMQKSDYVLRGADSKLTKVKAEKIPLPLDPCGHVQRLAMFLGPDKSVYAAQCSVLSKSVDGGNTWTHLERKTAKGEIPELNFMNFRVLSDGNWIRGESAGGQIVFSTSSDEGQSWQQVSRIGENLGTKDVLIDSLEVLSDGTLVAPVTAIYLQDDSEGMEAWRDIKSLCYTSKDNGKTFAEPGLIGEWGHEINLTGLPSGRLLAVIRYQRQQLPEDPSNIVTLTASKRHSHDFPYKHLFVGDSTDDGKTWSPMRQVTTECGQCHGQGVGLSDGRVVVAYDHRYPRPTAGARAVVSDDEGQSWRDEVYYLSNNLIAGFARSITLDGQEILTMTGNYGGEHIDDWNDAIGNTQFHVIRWRLAE